VGSFSQTHFQKCRFYAEKLGSFGNFDIGILITFYLRSSASLAPKGQVVKDQLAIAMIARLRQTSGCPGQPKYNYF
jgi:hypothetical protein